jgi:5-methylcytosine-specific restriction endonuclease McrA
MPIRPENRARYPKDWPKIRAAILERAGHCCEGSAAHPDCRVANYAQHPDTGSKVVLTIAHLDHTPENCEPSNLKAMCQRCHLKYDAEHHRTTAYGTRKARKAIADLFAAA